MQVIRHCYRHVIGFYYRCGADTRILSNDNKTAEDILLQERPEGWQEMQHWYNKFKPGIVVYLVENSFFPLNIRVY